MEEMIVGGRREHLGLRLAGADAPQCLESPHARHGEIHDHHIRCEIEKQLAGRLAGVGLADDRDLHARLQQEPKSHAHDGVIVDEQDAYHDDAAKGISAVRRVPPPAALATWKDPPNWVTRSLSPRRPKCPGFDHSAGRPMPSSVTVTMRRCGSLQTSTSTRDGFACRMALMTPSWITR